MAMAEGDGDIEGDKTLIEISPVAASDPPLSPKAGLPLSTEPVAVRSRMFRRCVTIRSSRKKFRWRLRFEMVLLKSKSLRRCLRTLCHCGRAFSWATLWGTVLMWAPYTLRLTVFGTLRLTVFGTLRAAHRRLMSSSSAREQFCSGLRMLR